MGLHPTALHECGLSEQTPEHILQTCPNMSSRQHFWLGVSRNIIFKMPEMLYVTYFELLEYSWWIGDEFLGVSDVTWRDRNPGVVTALRLGILKQK
jgi:hypothetical protein